MGGGLAGLGLGRAGIAVEVVDVTHQVDRVGIGLIARVMFALEEPGVLPIGRAAGTVLPGTSSTARVRNHALARLVAPY